VDIGGMNPAFFEASPTAQYDSWLTVGLTEGLLSNEIASTGVAFDACVDPWDSCLVWEYNQPLVITDGAMFWLEPDDGPSGAYIVIAQVTVATGTSFVASVNLQGRGEDRSVNDDGVVSGDWAETRVIFTVGEGEGISLIVPTRGLNPPTCPLDLYMSRVEATTAACCADARCPDGAPDRLSVLLPQWRD
jgi:hypothetical protein